MFQTIKYVRQLLCHQRYNRFHQIIFARNVAIDTTGKKYNNVDLCNKQDVVDFSQLEPDRFGDLSEKFGATIHSGGLLKSENIDDDPDGYDKLEIKRGIKISLPAYERILEEIYRKRPRNVNKLLKTFQDMVYVDRYRPNRNIYTMLINACAQVGYTKKAFELYKEMKCYKFKPTKAMVTALFNSCANCTLNKEYGLQNALLLREELESDGYEFNAIQYNVLIKTFALLGDWENVDTTIKEMKRKNRGINLDSYSMLLVGCISNQNNGLYKAIYIMRNILESNISLDVSIFNLFLRCIRDCKIKNEEKMMKIFEKIGKNNLMKNESNKRDCKLIKQGSQKVNENLPNLLTGANMHKIISIDFQSLSLAKNRFLLFGGINGFFKIMDSLHVKPDIKTMTMIIELLDEDSCFNEIMVLLSKYQLKPDVCLYNVLIKKFAKSRRYSLCKKMIRHMQENNIRPDIMTFGALAFSCNRVNYAKQFLNEMNQCLIIPNNQIIGTLINKACGHKNLYYLKFLLDYIESNNLKLSTIDIEIIDLLLNDIKKQVIIYERNNHKSKPFKPKISIKMFNEVSREFKQLLKKTEIQVNVNSWSQFECDNNYVSPKAQYHSAVNYMKRKLDVKMNRCQKEDIVDYNDEIDD